MQLAYFLGHKKEQGDGERKWLQRDLVRRLSSPARSQLVCMQASWQSCKNPRPWRLRQIPTVYPLSYPLLCDHRDYGKRTREERCAGTPRASCIEEEGEPVISSSSGYSAA
ncbi:hypothetical protein G5I_14602 [Acromyrmex echinatior]|uniref:Uncharacterized protein n=1 Tax=Acromyrmex echinatior TaxID=103372 RepID=F4X8C2_ACREC|nr:hypothetical protein G5I_14602 [Acromyrmex echinatior]